MSGAEQPARILVVEDEPSSRRGLELLLAEEGYGTTAVPDGEAALARAQKERFEVVVIDINLPKMNGYELTWELRNNSLNRDVPIILISAVAHSARRVAGLDGGADDFLPKPLDFDELMARVRVHLRHAARDRELARRCKQDPLTGVLNRYGLDEELDREIRRSQRGGHSLCMLMSDVDDFKAINDSFGHSVGDEALRRTAAKLVSVVRTTDRVGRYGGDEFVVILPDTSRRDAERLLRRLRASFRQDPPRIEEGALAVQISTGLASYRPGEGVADLLRRVDAAMYRDKHVHHHPVSG